MSLHTFMTFNNVTDASINVLTKSMPFIAAEERMELIEVEGRDGCTAIPLGKKPYILPVEIELMPNAVIDTVIATYQGSGVLTRADDTGKYVTGRVVNQLDYERLQATKTARIDFLIADPYRYVVSESPQTVTSFPAVVANSGTWLSLPLLKVTGSGTVALVLNGVTFTYVFPVSETYFYLDSNSKDAYYSSTTAHRNRSLTLVNQLFPYLSVGNNTLSITSGTVTEVIVTKRSRFV
jgi:phage-related protein